jgi:hypothetical protein
MPDLRDLHWNLPSKPETWEQVTVALLMDIRRELKQLNRVLACPNFTEIPKVLAQIRRNTTKNKRLKIKRA